MRERLFWKRAGAFLFPCFCFWCPEAAGVDTKRAVLGGAQKQAGGKRKADAEKTFTRAKQNACRDMSSRFAALGLSLPVPIQSLRHELEDCEEVTHWVKPSDWLQQLLTKAPQCILGSAPDSKVQLSAFWAAYKVHHPSHQVFAARTEEDLSFTVPLALFGDEGRGPKRGNFLVWSLESAVGLNDLCDSQCDCATSLAKLPPCDLLSQEVRYPQHVGMEIWQRASLQMTNMKGHSHVTRHLIFGLPHWLYKAKKAILDLHIDVMVQDMTRLLTDGVVVKGQTFYGALIAIKGDMKQHIWLGVSRSYHKLRAGMMCSLCEAGADGVPFDTHAEDPQWATTVFKSRPWQATPAICAIPFDDAAPEGAFALDPFHIYKVGMGRDLAGSFLSVLCREKMFDDTWLTLTKLVRFLIEFSHPEEGIPGEGKGIDERLKRAHAWFHLWCRTHGRAAGLRSFTKAFLNIKSKNSFPWTNSKGSDSILLLKFAVWYAGLMLQDVDRRSPLQVDFLKTFKATAEQGLKAFDVMYSHGLWLPRVCAAALYSHLMFSLRGYKKLARSTLDMGHSGFGLKPKFHAWHHLAWGIRRDMQRGAPFIMNPIVAGNEQNEDLVGRISRLARRLSTRTLTKNVISRYFFKKRALLWRACKNAGRKV